MFCFRSVAAEEKKEKELFKRQRDVNVCVHHSRNE
jgi:hypothetical protein